MEAKDKDYGIIYVFTNEWMPNLVKIGKTTRKDIQKRLNDLYYGKTGVPCNFKCEHAYGVPIDRMDALETAIHSYFESQHKRPNKHREFFNVTVAEVESLFKVVSAASGIKDTLVEDATLEVQHEIDKVTKADDKKAAHDKPAKVGKRPNMDFFGMGLKVGDVLQYKRDKTIACTVASRNRVNYQDMHGVSLTSVTTKLLQTKYSVQPSPYWQTIDGRSLTALYNEYVIAQTSANATAIADGIKICDTINSVSHEK